MTWTLIMQTPRREIEKKYEWYLNQKEEQESEELKNGI
jgi:hypothetical protein